MLNWKKNVEQLGAPVVDNNFCHTAIVNRTNKELIATILFLSLLFILSLLIFFLDFVFY